MPWKWDDDTQDDPVRIEDGIPVDASRADADADDSVPLAPTAMQTAYEEAGEWAGEAPQKHGRETAEAREERRRESDREDAGELRALRFALSRAQRAAERRDRASLATINESLQPVVDAFMAWHDEAVAAARDSGRRATLVRRGEQLTCPMHPNEQLLWESVAGTRVYREVGGRRVYRASCPHCGTFDVDGGAARG